MENKSQESPKVISILDMRKAQTASTETKADASAVAGSEADASGDSNFLDEMRRNLENAERMKRERLKANQAVLKSYRIKN